MRVKARRQKGESTAQFLKRFLTRVQKSGITLETKRRMYQRKGLNEKRKKQSRLYKLKIQQFVTQRLKEGWNLDKSLKMARRYVDDITYKGE